MKRLLIFSAALLLATVSMAQGSAQSVKRVGILEVVDKSQRVSQDVKLYLRQTLVVAINEMEGYKAVTRINMNAIKDEHKFERSGYVSDSEIKALGRMNSVEYVLVAEVAPHRNVGYVTLAASLYDVVTGDIVKASEPERASDDERSDEMETACRKVAHTLLKGRQGGSAGTTGGTYTGAAMITIQVPGTNVSFDMVKVEAGTFTMGCTSEQGVDCHDYEKNYHRVTLSNDYYIGKFEVTQELYETVMGVNPSKWKSYDRPVEQVSWNDAQEFCAKLSRLTGMRFTLPTEAEWEYAARGGKRSTSAKYSGSNSIANVAWLENSGGQTHPVGKLRPNELGIYDMSGNVWEWCLDWYGDYSSMSQTDPKGPATGSGRVLRGGSFGNSAWGCRVAHRDCTYSDFRNCTIGFRVVLH